jgi:molybdate transport system ATP-binding protein
VGGGAAFMNLSVRLRTRLSSQFQLDVAFEAAPGVTIVFGESGSGKTTLLRSVAGLTRPEAGRIAVGDHVLFDESAAIDLEASRRKVGFVFQHLALFPHLSAEENIGYGLAHLSVVDRRERIAAIAASFGIDHLLARRPGQISGGERQRVGLARSLVTNPDVLLLDEPLSALDHATQSRIIADVRRWHAARAIPILYVTHSQREVFALGERVLVLQDGRIVADGTPQAVMESPSQAPLAQLAGFENLLDAAIVERRPEAGVMVARLAGTTVDLEAPLADLDGASVRIAIRAGDILVASEHPRGLSARNIVRGTIASLSREGPVVRAAVDVGTMLEAHITPASSEELALRIGVPVWLVIKTHSCRPVAGR